MKCQCAGLWRAGLCFLADWLCPFSAIRSQAHCFRKTQQAALTSLANLEQRIHPLCGNRYAVRVQHNHVNPQTFFAQCIFCFRPTRVNLSVESHRQKVALSLDASRAQDFRDALELDFGGLTEVQRGLGAARFKRAWPIGDRGMRPRAVQADFSR